jgi:hypothetical protein
MLCAVEVRITCDDHSVVGKSENTSYKAASATAEKTIDHPGI